MATEYNRQYVGARYVPQFFNNPDGSWDWAQGFQYEPLTIVKYGENTYTSKMLVPITVGSPNLNSEYWANTGNYNGFISELNNRITIVENEINIAQMKGRYFLFIGDDYGTVENNWVDNVALALGLNPSQYQNMCTVGAGFKAKINKNYLDELQSFTGNKNKVTDIIICGGINDAIYPQYNALAQDISNVEAYISNNFPIAKVSIGYISEYASIENENIYRTTRINALNQYLKASNKWRIIPNIQYFMHITYNNFQEDNLLPTPTASLSLSKYIASFILGGGVNITSFINDYTVTGVSITGTLSLLGLISNELWEGTLKGSITINNYQETNDKMVIASLENVVFTSGIEFNSSIIINDGDDFKLCNVNIYLYNKSIQVKIRGVNNGNIYIPTGKNVILTFDERIVQNALFIN